MATIQLLAQVEQDFESGVGAWAIYNGAATPVSDATQAHSGTKSAKIVTTAINQGMVVSKNIDAGSSSAACSLWLYGVAGHTYTLYFAMPSGEIITRTFSGTASWQQFSLTSADAPGTGTCNFYVWDATGAGTFWVDDCSLTETIAVAPGSMSGVQTVTLTGGDYWLLHPTISSYSCRLAIVKTDDFSEQYEEAEMNILGRGRKKDYGTRWGYKGQLVAEIWDRSDLTARQQRLNLMALKAQKRDVYLRNPFGDLWLVAMGEAGISRVAGVGQLEFVVVTLPYAEVS